MDCFEYKGSSLYCEDLPLKELAIQFGTPLYVYSYSTLERHFRVFDEALGSVKHIICYAVKANSNLAVLRIMSNLGSGADVVSGGELFRCIRAGISPSKIVFSGVGKTIQEIEYALQKNILFLSVESKAELEQIERIAETRKTKARISLRLNPDVDPKTHAYISTGLHKNKFGLPQEEAMGLYTYAARSEYLDPVGLNLHIGSQITEIDPFVDAVKIACDVIRKLRQKGVSIQYFDCGGGLGVRYRDEDPPIPKDYAQAVVPLIQDLDLTVLIEPGRSMMGNAGVLLTRVLYLKKTPKKEFVIVDAAMNDLLRPALYQAEHEILPVMQMKRPKFTADIVGPICETGDFFARDREIEQISSGELLCIRTTGAYGFVMASQYNSRPRAAEVLVKGDQVDLIRRRESFEDLIQHESMPKWL